MTSFRTPTAALLALAFAIAGLGGQPASAAADVADLRDRVLAADLAAERVALSAVAATVEAGFRLSVDVGASAPDVWLREVWLQVDDAPIQHYRYSQQEAVALRAGGLHGLLERQLPPGAHRIRAQAAAAGVAAHANDARRRAAVDITVSGEQSPVELELSWGQGGMVSASSLKLLQWQRGGDAPSSASDSRRRYQPGEAGDPRLRQIAFLDAVGRRYPARRLLAELQAEGLSPSLPEAPPAASASPGPDALYDAYNSLLGGSGKLAAIDALGAAAPCDSRPGLLCDRINTELGYAWLAEREGLKAAAAFRRVRAPGPQASAALLGLGWALLAPATAAEAAAEHEGPEASPVPVAQGGSRHPPRAMKLKERGPAMRAALVPWIELVGRDPGDPAVQEAQIAIAWAMRELGAEVQAQEHYNRIIVQLDDLVRRSDKARAELAARPLASDWLDADPASTWHWSLADRLPDPRWWVLPMASARESFYLVPLFQQPGFDAVLQALRDDHEMRAALQARREQLTVAATPEAASLIAVIDGLLGELSAQVAAGSAALDAQALAGIDAIRAQALRTLADARHGLAQLYDRAAEVASK